MMTMNEPTGETFAEGSDIPPVQDAAPVIEDVVSLEALSQPDEQEAMTPPAVGDKVSYSKEGTVSRIEGGKAFVAVTHVNGQEVKPDAPEAMPDAMAGLEAEGQAMDEQSGY